MKNMLSAHVVNERFTKKAIICPFCKFGIMVWLEGKIDENGDPIKDKSK